MKISIVIATRKRYDSLINLIHSIYDKAFNIDNIELIVVYDNDDGNTKLVLEENGILSNINLISRERSIYLNRDYWNFGAKQATGDFIWGLGNDTVLVEQDWDKIICNKAEEFFLKQQDKIMYGYVGDDIHNTGDIKNIGGCCFPLMSKESYDAVGWLIPPEITKWGGDHWLWMIYKQIKVNRFLDLREDIHVVHFCHHNGRTEQDDLNKETQQQSYVNYINDDKMTEYINLINSRIN